MGAVRPAKFAKYLPDFGWDPVVYTVKDRYYERCDYGKFEPRLKSITIYRANLIPGPLEAYTRLAMRKNLSHPALLETQTDVPELSNPRGLAKILISSFLRLPDEKQGWIINIVLDGFRILRKHEINVILTSGPPWTTHLGGLILKYLTKIRWVADFRDPWTINNFKTYQMRSRWSDAVEKWLENKVILKADKVVSTTPSLTNYFKSILPADQNSKCLTITNGFDESDFDGIGNFPAPMENKKIRISYAGTLYYNRNPEPFFMALRTLILRDKIEKDDVEIDFIGDCAYYQNVSVQRLIDRYELSKMVRLVGMVPFQTCMKRLTQSNALLLFAQGQPQQIPGKVFEYIRLNKPILAITEEGETRRILKRFNRAFFADPSSTEQIGQKFMLLLDAAKCDQGDLVSHNEIKKYDCRRLSGKLARCLD
jgi:glycosyltransferase involved in cell wall biosynthesis